MSELADLAEFRDKIIIKVSVIAISSRPAGGPYWPGLGPCGAGKDAAPPRPVPGKCTAESWWPPPCPPPRDENTIEWIQKVKRFFH